MNLSSHPYAVNGVRLDTLAWGIESSAMRLGEARAGDAILAGVDGYVPSTDDPREASTLTLSMFIRGCDEDGLVPADADAYATLRENLAELLHTFGGAGALLDVREAVGTDWTDGGDGLLTGPGVRQFTGKVLDALEPELAVGSVARLGVVISNPGVYWRDLTTADFTKAAVVSGTTYEVSTLEGSSAPVDDAVVVLAGPTSGAATITDVATGAYVRLNTALAAGQAWRVNSATWESRTGSLTVGSADTTGTDASANTTQGGVYPRLLRLHPRRMDGTRKVRVKVDAPGMTAATTLTIRARRAHL